MSAKLDSDLIAAHARGDLKALVELYRAAAKDASSKEAHAFYLTHAYVFALDGGLPEAKSIGAELRRLDRD